MTKEELKERLTSFSIRIVKMVDAMPNTIASVAIAKQIIRSGTSPAANYRAACLAKSDKDFVNKLKMVEEELDETSHWIDVLVRSGIMSANRMDKLSIESKELLNIISKSIITTKARMQAERNETSGVSIRI